MHNSPKKNLEFEITFTETNLFYFLGETPVNEEKIKQIRAKISELKEKLKTLG